MKNPPVLMKVRPVIYNDRYLRLLAALFSAHLIVAYGENETFLELIVLPGYFAALASSFLIALVLVEAIYRCTCYFDKQYPWETNIVKRSYAQIMGGICLPLLMDCAMAAAYFGYHGTNLVDAGYFKYNFTIIILLVTLFNAYYLIHYMVKLKLKRVPRHIKPKQPVNPSFDDPDYPLLILMQDGICISVNREDKVSYHARTLEQFYNNLPEENYFLVNRATIIERSAIEKMVPGRSRTIKLDVRSKLYPNLRVSQRNAPAFKEWLELAR